MAVYIGNTEISKIYQGSTVLSSLNLGSGLNWSPGPAPPSYPGFTAVTSAMIQSVSTTGGYIISQGDDGPGGNYKVSFQHTSFGCGGPDNGVRILIKNTISWSKIIFDWSGTGWASCWSFMPPEGGYGAGLGSPHANIADLNTSNGHDKITNNVSMWEVSTYQSHDRLIGCNNAGNNPFRFNSGYKAFTMYRTRNTSAGGYAGIHHGRSCSASGNSTITNIYIA